MTAMTAFLIPTATAALFVAALTAALVRRDRRRMRAATGNLRHG
ncbi:hypothetical protein [Streptomyces sp. NPDC004065]